MVLKGSLGTFDIISIIQMITSQQATGVLHIKGTEKKDVFDILIDNGRLIRIMPLFEIPVKYIAERLVKAGLLESGQLKVILNAVKKEDFKEADIPKRFSVSVSSLMRLTLSVTYESLHTMHHFRKGTYEFEPRGIAYDPELNEPMNTEFLLMESSRVVDEVSHLNWRYNDDIVFDKTVTEDSGRQPPPQVKQPAKKSNAGDEFVIERTSVSLEPDQQPEESALEEKHKSPEEIILELVNGRRTAGEIYYLSLLSKNEVILELGNLIREGKISVLSYTKEPFKPVKKSVLSRVVDSARSGIILLLNLIIIIMILSYSRINPFRMQGVRTDITYTNLLKYAGNYQQIKLSNALEIYKLEYGSYPASLKTLVDRHIISSKDLTFPYGSEYYYSKQDGSYILLAPKYAAK